MAFYNDTCLISNLHIEDGDEIIAILIVPNKINPKLELRGASGVLDYYRPYPLILEGTYSSEGYPINIKSNKITKTFSKLLNCSSEDEIFQKIFYQEISDINFVLIHKKIFGLLIEEFDNFNLIKEHENYVHSIRSLGLSEKHQLKLISEYFYNFSYQEKLKSFPNELVLEFDFIDKNLLYYFSIIKTFLFALRSLGKTLIYTGCYNQEKNHEFYKKIIREFLK